jgi:hypothetical protein
MNRAIHESFQMQLEELAHAGHCDQPRPFQQKPYGVVSVALERKSVNPVYLGVLLVEENQTGRINLDPDDLAELLQDTMVTLEDGAMILYWPKVKYSHDV